MHVFLGIEPSEVMQIAIEKVRLAFDPSARRKPVGKNRRADWPLCRRVIEG
jgi:hypothetical protein